MHVATVFSSIPPWKNDHFDSAMPIYRSFTESTSTHSTSLSTRRCLLYSVGLKLSRQTLQTLVKTICQATYRPDSFVASMIACVHASICKSDKRLHRKGYTSILQMNHVRLYDSRIRSPWQTHQSFLTRDIWPSICLTQVFRWDDAKSHTYLRTTTFRIQIY